MSNTSNGGFGGRDIASLSCKTEKGGLRHRYTANGITHKHCIRCGALSYKYKKRRNSL